MEFVICSYVALKHTIKIQRNVQGNVLLTVLDFLLFPNIASPTTSYLRQFELLLLELIPGGATMIS